MRHLLAIFVGGIVTTIFGLLLGGYIFLVLIMILVLCTYGLGLIPLLFGFWMVGWLILGIIAGVRGNADGDADDIKNTKNGMLAEFIRRDMKLGLPTESIKSKLYQNGFTDAEIAEAWRIAESKKPNLVSQ